MALTWEQETRDILDLGFDGFDEDFSEEVLLEMTFVESTTGKAMHNRHPLL